MQAMNLARIHDKQKLKKFWEQKIERHHQMTGNEEARMKRSALSKYVRLPLPAPAQPKWLSFGRNGFLSKPDYLFLSLGFFSVLSIVWQGWLPRKPLSIKSKLKIMMKNRLGVRELYVQWRNTWLRPLVKMEKDN